ncbi:hypothetical protein A8P48_12215 [Yersinia pestis]|nr:hypothetical protein AU082_05465 [Yersinia pestis]PCN62260.1 hypothetical protein A8V21_18705 [Yersinia pestis]PCN66010.1 hypothetical protein A8P48_12215 [Yersinia pestis]
MSCYDKKVAIIGVVNLFIDVTHLCINKYCKSFSLCSQIIPIERKPNLNVILNKKNEGECGRHPQTKA